MYEEIFKKEDKIKLLEKKIKLDTGLTFKPKVNSSYKTPMHVKMRKTSTNKFESMTPCSVDYKNLLDPMHP